MKGELEFLQGAFEAYKGTLVQDMEEKWAKKESDMKIRFQENMDKALHEQREYSPALGLFSNTDLFPWGEDFVGSVQVCASRFSKKL